MNIAVNVLGITVAVAAFLGIWLGHVTVRYVEFRSSTVWLPAAVSLLLGVGLEAAALFSSTLLSAVLGVFGITVLWSALEFFRQEKRVKKGHAPANPQNPRHSRILAKFSAATTQNLLERVPTGAPVNKRGQA